MPLAEAVAIEIGAAVAKSILKVWVKDSVLFEDISSSLIDLFKGKTSDILAQRRGNRQFETIGEKVGESLLPLFEAEGAHLDEASRTSVALAVAAAFNTSKLSTELLVRQNLEPTRLAKHVLSSAHPTAITLFSSVELAFYQRIIEECCTYIVDISSQLPSFTEQTFAEILKRDDQIIIKTNKIIDELQQIRKQLNPTIEGELFEKDYRETVKRHLDILQLLGMDASPSNRRHRLSVAYITLAVTQKVNSSHHKINAPLITKQAHGSLQEADERETVSAYQALNLSHRLLIRGQAGSGKTTFLQWIAVRSATRSFEKPLLGWNDSIPFFIRLRHCIQSGLPRPEAFPSLVAPAIASRMPPGWAHAQLESGRGLVLVDGVDEISTSQREEVRTWLNDLAEVYPRSRFIITSRPNAIDEDWMKREDFCDAELQPMELTDIYTFIDRWHEAIREELYEESEKTELVLLAEQLKGDVRRNHPIRNLATNPLMCAMLCTLNRDHRRQLPEDRIELYEECCRLLLERRDKARGIDLTDYPAFTYRQKRLLLEGLAYWMIKNDMSEVQLELADEYFTRKLLYMPNISPDITGDSVRRLYVERSGMIREPIDGFLDFAHRTFQEFLAAKAASDDLDVGVLTENAQNDQWREVIILASGLATKQMREELIKRLISRGDAEKEKRYQLHLLAISCLETSIELSTTVRIEVEKRLGQLVPPKNMADAKALAAAGELAVKYLARKAKLSAVTAAACIRALALIGGEEALERIEGYASDTRSTVVNELIKAWDFFNASNYAERVLTLILRDGTDFHFERLSSLNNFQYLINLKSLNLAACPQITDLSPLAGLYQLQRLNLEDCSQITDLSPLASLTQIKSLNLTNCKQIKDLSPFIHLIQLEELNLTGCSQITDLSPLASLTQIKSLNLSYCDQLADLSLLTKMTQLTSLELPICKLIEDLSPLASLVKLRMLHMPFCSQVQDLSSLANLSQLTTLKIPNCSQAKDLSFLADLTQLTSLDLSYCGQISDLSPLEGLKKLKYVNLSICEKITDLSPLKHLLHLEKINLQYCDRISDLSPLAHILHLKSLDVTGCKRVNDLSSLQHLNKLNIIGR